MTDYEIGYGKPPKHTQFKPGQSGNPKGKSRGSRGLRTELRAELSELMTITENGKSRRIPKQRVVIKSLAAKAVRGDVRAAEKLMQLAIQANGFEDPTSERSRLSNWDLQIVEWLSPQESAAEILGRSRAAGESDAMPGEAGPSQ